ncbi:ABC transporter permease [Halosimplex aquaticum]|uniref:ABC transporter permease n=1 Tax=Halosimplex aquaticum TaxID=3026162 RepID=A0ABD5Y1N7_9EURY|nr:ABC transporter permease [Halosimplex aquaticum]
MSTDDARARVGGGRSTALAAFVGGLREYARTPVLLALFVFLPAYLIGGFTRLVPSTTTPLDVPGGGTQAVEMAALYAVLMVPLVGALVGALAGVFLIQAARDADARLVVAGARPVSVLLARFGLLAVVGALVAAVSVATAATIYVPERPLIVGVAALLAALTYGLLGVLAGLVVDRLAGVYLALFGTMMDLFLVQNPLADPPEYARLLPGHVPVELAVDAGFSTDVALSVAGEGAAYLLAVGAVTALALYRTMRVS